MSEEARNEHKVVGQRLRDARESIGFTQLEVAEALGVSRPTLVALEQGSRKITGLELRRLARLYQRDVAWLLGDDPKDSASSSALHRTTAALSESDREQVLRFAEFLAAQGRGGSASGARSRPRPPRSADET